MFSTTAEDNDHVFKRPLLWVDSGFTSSIISKRNATYSNMLANMSDSGSHPKNLGLETLMSRDCYPTKTFY